MKNWILTHLSVFVVAMLGAFVGCALEHSPPALAQGYLQGTGMSINGYDGRLRLQLATYEAAGEKGLPMVGLTDNRSHLRLLLRLAGPNEAPVIVMKDTRGTDRLVLGLGMSGPGEEPFLATFDSRGQKRMIFGSY